MSKNLYLCQKTRVSMKLLEFTKRFPDEESCIRHLKEQREKAGVVCSHCGGPHQRWDKYNKCWVCSKCGHHTTLRSGTVMHGSKLPLMYWFTAIHLMTSTKKTFPALEMQRQLGHKRYQPTWEMMRKLRSAMGLRDGKYTLNGIVELDEGFFTCGDKRKGGDDKEYHGIKDEFLQEYLNEFCYKFNRRYFGDKVFDRLVIAAISYKPAFEHRMYGSVSLKCG